MKKVTTILGTALVAFTLSMPAWAQATTPSTPSSQSQSKTTSSKSTKKTPKKKSSKDTTKKPADKSTTKTPGSGK